MKPEETDPRDIDMEGPTSPLKITWEDDHESVYELEYLRRMCPCAECTQHGATPLEERLNRVLQERAVQVKSFEQVGNYALQFTWGDGHSTGIYSYNHLREICACPICRPRLDWDV